MKRKSKQIAAWICIALLLCLYVATFIIAALDFPGSDVLFRSCLAATIGLPILLWIYIWLYGKVKDKHTIASLDILQTGSGKPAASDKQTDSDKQAGGSTPAADTNAESAGDDFMQ